MPNKDKNVQIISSDNKSFKKLKQLLEPRGIKKFGEFLIFGESVVNEYERLHADRIIAKIYSTAHNISLQNNDYELSAALFKEIDIFGTKSPILWVKAQETKAWSLKDKACETEIFIATGDPSNLGALLRSCAAFNWKKIILLKECANPHHPKAIRASAGLSARLTLYQGPSIQELNSVENLYALDLHGENLYQTQPTLPLRLLVGEEGPGVPGTLNLKKINIPMHESVESLNATVAASIVMSYFYGKSYTNN